MSEKEKTDRKTGTVKWFNSRKGYGFIEPDKGNGDLFVHYKDLASETTLNEGDKVSFEVKQAEKGPQAVNVKVEGKK